MNDSLIDRDSSFYHTSSVSPMRQKIMKLDSLIEETPGTPEFDLSKMDRQNTHAIDTMDVVTKKEFDNYIDAAYPDFGFQDDLTLELRHHPNAGAPSPHHIWALMYDYISGS